MKLFLDTADVDAVRTWVHTGLIDGLTTNPTHLSAQQHNPTEIIQTLCSLLPHGQISVEVTEKEPQKVYEQAHKIAALSPNILVKIPCHADYYGVIKKLVQEKIRINITLVFSLAQALFMAKLNVEYVSPFIGRLDDNNIDGAALLYEMRTVFNTYKCTTKILAASLRHAQHVTDALLAGADALTLPVGLFEKIIQHPLTDRGMELFDRDWQKLQITQFP